MSNNVLTITDSQFDAEVLSVQQPVLVYFWAPWCGPCRLMTPLMEGVASSYGDRLKVVKMEVDPNPETVAKYSVQGVPVLLLFEAGKLMMSNDGAIPKQRIESLLNEHLAPIN